MRRCRHCKKKRIPPLRASAICMACEKTQTDRRLRSEQAVKEANINVLISERRTLRDRV